MPTEPISMCELFQDFKQAVRFQSANRDGTRTDIIDADVDMMLTPVNSNDILSADGLVTQSLDFVGYIDFPYPSGLTLKNGDIVQRQDTTEFTGYARLYIVDIQHQHASGFTQLELSEQEGQRNV